MIDILELLQRRLAEGDSTTTDLSQGDILLDYAPRAPLQRNWTGPPPAGFALPRSGYTNPFLTPEYGWQSSPTNPVISDRPPEIPPGWSKTRGEHSRARIASPGNAWINQNAPFPTQARPNPPPMQWTNEAPVMDPADTANYGPGSPFGRKPPPPELLAQMQRWWDETQMPQQQPAAPAETDAIGEILRSLQAPQTATPIPGVPNPPDVSFLRRGLPGGRYKNLGLNSMMQR